MDPAPILVSMGPTGSGSSATFTAQIKDSVLATNITESQIWFNLSSSGNCHLAYYPSVNQIYLDTPTLTYNWVGSGTPGSGTVLSNAFCTVNLAGASVVNSGMMQTLVVPISFSTVGTMHEYVSATNPGGTAGWTNGDVDRAGANTYGASYGKRCKFPVDDS